MKKIIILCGGPSSEYEVSLLSSQSIIDSIDYSKYDISICLISKDLNCKIKDISEPEAIYKLEANSCTFNEALERLKDYDVVLLGTHGQFGEDGVLQTYLEQKNIRYTGSDSYSSRLSMDKYRSSIIVNSCTELSLPETQLVRLEDLKSTLEKTKLPIFLKPNKNGSSVCSYIVKDLNNVESMLKELYQHHKKQEEILIQELIDNMVEVSCGCLERKDHTFIQLPPIEILPKNSDFFDYKAKYEKGASLERIPAIGITETQRDLISQLAVEIHKLLGCRLYSRSDFLIRDNNIYYLETNTLPGMTSTSLIPQEAKAVGIEYKELISFYIENA